MKFVFICGLPGSGKTHLGRQMGELFLDDICQTCGKDRLKDDFPTKTVIVADPSLCRSLNRIVAEEIVKVCHPNCEVEWIFFENNPEQCWQNVRNREDSRIISRHSIFDLSRHYQVPPDVKVLSVWKN